MQLLLRDTLQIDSDVSCELQTDSLPYRGYLYGSKVYQHLMQLLHELDHLNHLFLCYINYLEVFKLIRFCFVGYICRHYLVYIMFY